MSAIVRNNVTVHGQGLGQGRPTLLFAHGFGCDQSMWRHVAAGLKGRATLALFDHVGAGGSDLAAYDPSKYDSLDGYAADVIEICEALGHGPVVFIGHSVSASIGAIAAARRPDLFAELVLVCPSPRYADDAGYEGGFSEADLLELLDLLDKNQLDWSEAVSPIIMGEGQAPVEAEWRESVCRMDPGIARQFARVTFLSDTRADFRRVVTPTLLIGCRSDALVPAEVSDWVQAAIPGSRLQVLETSGHCPHMSAPSQVVEALEPYLLPLAA